MSTRKSLSHYSLLGRSGLRISPLSLGTMTFGQPQTWGADAQESLRIFKKYIEAGGNFIDTANVYGQGASETLVGDFVADMGVRDEIVIATKYSLAPRAGGPNLSGNHRKSMLRSVEDSLRKLKTDYLDLFYLHVWDFTTPVDEIMRSFDDLVRQGKVRYVGISDAPAWQIARMQTLADFRGWSPFVALQIEYSLIERTVEAELAPMARELGLGVLPWSPLGGGLLSGKYVKGGDASPAGESSVRKAMVGRRLNERTLGIAQCVADVAEEVGASSAQTALAWLLHNPAVAAPVIGARTVDQYDDNVRALEVALSEAQLQRLNAASEPPAIFPYGFYQMGELQRALLGPHPIASRS